MRPSKRMFNQHGVLVERTVVDVTNGSQQTTMKAIGAIDCHVAPVIADERTAQGTVDTPTTYTVRYTPGLINLQHGDRITLANGRSLIVQTKPRDVEEGGWLHVAICTDDPAS